MFYDLSWISMKNYRHIIASDLHEAGICKKNKAYKAASILLGSAMEALLLYSLQRACISTPANTSLGQLLELAQENKIIAKRNVYLGHAVRECRNLVHPEKCMREKYEANNEKTKLLFQVYSEILQELKKNLETYEPIKGKE